MSTNTTEPRVFARRGIRGFARIYSALFRISILGQIQYRASGIIWMLGSILEPIIFLMVWSAVADSQGGEVRGLTLVSRRMLRILERNSPMRTTFH